MKTFLFTTGVLFSLLSCVAQEQPIPAKSTGGVESKSIEYGGLTRTYDLFLPPNVVRPMPLVVMLHGGGGNSKEAAYSTRWVAKAMEKSFMVVFPNGTRPDPTKPAAFGENSQTWNDGSTRSLFATENNIDDAGFIRALIGELSRTFPVDRRRIYATGFSNGASMAFLLGIDCSDIFAAIAPVAGSLWLENSSLKHPLSILYITGDSDPLNPYNGGEVRIGQQSYGVKKPVPELITLWADLLGAKRDTAYQQGAIQTIIYQAPQAEVVWLTVQGMGHHWPGGNVTLPQWMAGKPSNALDGTSTIWAFFAKHSK